MNAKRYISYFLLLALLVTLVGCGGQAGQPGQAPEPQEPGAAAEPAEPEVETPEPQAEPPEAAYSEPEEPRFDLPDIIVKEMVEFVSCFNMFPEEFEDPATLSDQALLFAGAQRCSAQFEPDQSGSGYSIPLESLNATIKATFGAGAALSDGYAENDYYPYEVDSRNGRLLRYAGSGVGSFYLTFAVVELPGQENCYELWLIDLMDPLYYGDGEHQDELAMGALPGFEDIELLAPDMQTNIYTVEKISNGYILRGFRYKNFKDIDHMAF